MTFRFHKSVTGMQPIKIPAIGLELVVPLTPEVSGGDLTVIETINMPGFGPPLHRHVETEVFRVLEGRYLYQVNGDRFEAQTGDVVSIPGGASHAFKNVSKAPARQLVMILPGLDAIGFFTGLGKLTEGGLPGADELNAFSREWGIEFLGPPL